MNNANDECDVRVQIAARLTSIRKQKNLTLTAMAEQSGIAKGTLSTIESGRGNPTLETIWAIAKILQVPFSELIQSDSVQNQSHTVHDSGVDVQLIERNDGERVTEAYRMHLQSGVRRMATAHPAGVVEKVTVLKGRLLAGLVTAPVLLTCGKTACFDADCGHVYEAVGGAVSALVVMTYPAVKPIQSEMDIEREWPCDVQSRNDLLKQLQRIRFNIGQGIAANRITLKPHDMADRKTITRLVGDFQHKSIADESSVSTWVCQRDLCEIITLPEPSFHPVYFDCVTDTELKNTLYWSHLMARVGISVSEQQLAQARQLLNQENQTLASLATEILIQQNKAEENDLSVIADQVDLFDITLGSCAMQVVTLVTLLKKYLHQPPYSMVQLGSEMSWSQTLLKQWFPQINVVSFKENEPGRDVLSEVSAVISMGVFSKEPSLSVLQQAHSRLSVNGLLVVAEELVAPFTCHHSRKRNLLRHHLACLCAMLFRLRRQNRLQKMVDEPVLDLMVQQLPIARFEAITGNIDSAAHICRMLIKEIQTLTSYQKGSESCDLLMLACIKRLQILVDSLDQSQITTTYLQRLWQLAESVGFEVLQHHRLYATDGFSKSDAGIHVMALRKRI
ncbi:MAG: hypothetical protein CENE_02253 [Candidatus Celerinatantimonas neptuna]|nr:MAG: hypothetical protein CENE_02253 [Candidatus Celerinatantimonas neptuna]